MKIEQFLIPETVKKYHLILAKNFLKSLKNTSTKPGFWMILTIMKISKKWWNIITNIITNIEAKISTWSRYSIKVDLCIINSICRFNLSIKWIPNNKLDNLCSNSILKWLTINNNFREASLRWCNLRWEETKWICNTEGNNKLTQNKALISNYLMEVNDDKYSIYLENLNL
jgi:hypothetical protein